MPAAVRIAMWSGPRNISTALMRSWGNRPDTIVIDEPFYALFLKRTGAPHPGATEVISQGETNERTIVDGLVSPLPNGKTIFYQKQMTLHLLPGMDRAWLDQVINCFLIRDPADVITSYIRKRERPTLQDLGFAQQVELFGDVRRRIGTVPPVIDAADVLRDPKKTLSRLCDAIGVVFDDAMLSWPAGFRDTDGIWAKYWYNEVAKSTGFQPYKPKKEPVPDCLGELHQKCREHYNELYQYRLS
jgi:hypothetical protein